MKLELVVAIFLVLAIMLFTTPTVPYLRDFDSWYHYRLAEYTFEQGFRPNFDPLSNTGENVVYPPLLHYILALPAHIPGMSVMLDAQVYPVIADIITIVFIFLFTREVFDERTAILAALLISILPILKIITSFGFSDHDSMDFVFISSTIFFFVKAMKQASPVVEGTEQSLPNRIPPMVYYSLAGISIGLFALTWEGFPVLVVLLSSFIVISAILNSRLKLLDIEVVIGFLLLSVISTLIASLWYGTRILPIFAIEIFSAAFSYVAVRFERSSRVTLLLAVIIVCSTPLVYLFRGDIINVGLTYLGLIEENVYLQYVAEMKTPTLPLFLQYYGVQLLPFIGGLVLFVFYTKKLNRPLLFFIISVAFFMFLASTAIRFVQYFGIFVSILSAYLLSWLFTYLNKSVKRDAFIPLMLLSALFFTQPLLSVLPTMTFSVTDDWHNSLTWLNNNSNPNDVVLSWWDYAQWVNGIAWRKTVVNNQPPGRFDDQMVFFGTDDWQKAEGILKKYNVSYVLVSRGYLARILTAQDFINDTIDFQTATPVKQGVLYELDFGGGYTTYFDPTSLVAWDQSYEGVKTYYREVGVLNGDISKEQYFTANVSGADFNDYYLFLYSDIAIRIPKETENRVFFNLMYTNSTIPYLTLVKETGEVRIYKVLK